MHEINVSDYISACLIEDKVGRMSSDMSKVVFGSYCLSDVLSVAMRKLDNNDFEPINHTTWQRCFDLSAPVSATILRIEGDKGELYWVLCLSIPLKKKMIVSKKKYEVFAVGCGTEK